MQACGRERWVARVSCPGKKKERESGSVWLAWWRGEIERWAGGRGRPREGTAGLREIKEAGQGREGWAGWVKGKRRRNWAGPKDKMRLGPCNTLIFPPLEIS